MDTQAKAQAIKLLLTDCDGVLTDGGVYYSEYGEQLKKFNIRDGMAVERLRDIVAVEVGIVSGERSGSLRQRATKLAITECHLGVKDKAAILRDITQRKGIALHQVAYIGDDVNDLEVLEMAGLSACPSDAFRKVKSAVDVVCRARGGEGAFREFAEMIIDAKCRDEEV